MKTIRSFFNLKFSFIVSILFIIIITDCSKDDNGITNPENNSSSLSYSGEISVLIDSLIYHEVISVSFTKGDEITGSYFQFSDGLTGLFTGNKNGNEYQISGSFDDYLNGSFSGVINTINDNEIDFQLEGYNNDIYFESNGLLSKINCINIEGNYLAYEELTITIEIGGESETDTFEGIDYIYLDQQNCQVSYIVPGTETNRVGDVASNLLAFSGIFLIPGEGLVLTKNEFYADVSISNQYNYTFIGEGIAEGTYEGYSVRITGNTSGTLKRQFDVAVGILRGGSWWYDPLSLWIITPELIQIENQVLSQYPTEVVAKCFPTGNQINNVKTWLNYFVNTLETPNINVILVGHSLGANAIRIGDFSNYNLYSRISIDPINPDEIDLLHWAESANQRELVFPVDHFQGYYFNYLATTIDIINGENPHDLLGHHITQAVEYPEENTNHMTIVDRVVEEQYVLNQVTNCLSQSNHIRNKVSTTNHTTFPKFEKLKIISLFNYSNK